MILVTGGTGTTGGTTLDALARAGVPARALVRDPAKLAPRDGIEAVAGTFEDAASLDAALAGVSHAYLVLPASPEQVALETAFVEAAVRAGVEHLVLLSVIGAEYEASDALRFGRAHRAVEAAVHDSGLGWTFLRPNGFLQNYLGQAATIAAQGAFYSPDEGIAGVSYVDARDIGEVAARALTEEGHLGQAYTLTGPEALTDDDIAARMTAVLGRPVAHVTVPRETARENMAGMGVPAWTIDGLTELWGLYASGAAAPVSPDIERVLGRPARSVDDFVADHRAAFGG